jgi:hypothetical protein
MPTWLDKLRGASADTSEISAYRALREASKSWFDKIMAHPGSKRFDMLKAGRKLGAPMHGRTFIFEDETEMAVLTDYYLFDYRPDGESLAESITFSPGELTELELVFHEANLTSRTSLFEIVRAHAQNPTILLRDLLNPAVPEVWLTDLGFSDSFRRFGGRRLMFTRVVSARGLHVTGGFSFIFDGKHESALVDGYRRAMWSVAPQHHDHRRTGYFLALNRKLGLAQRYADVEPPSE